MKKTFIIFPLIAFAVSACHRTPPTEVTIVGNGTETCTKAEPCDGTKPPVDSDPR